MAKLYITESTHSNNASIAIREYKYLYYACGRLRCHSCSIKKSWRDKRTFLTIDLQDILTGVFSDEE